jgi:hypothetical protein
MLTRSPPTEGDYSPEMEVTLPLKGIPVNDKGTQRVVESAAWAAVGSVDRAVRVSVLGDFPERNGDDSGAWSVQPATDQMVERGSPCPPSQ